MSKSAYKNSSGPGLLYEKADLVVDTEHGIAVLHELTGRQPRVVRLGHGVGHGVAGDHRPGRGDPDTGLL